MPFSNPVSGVITQTGIDTDLSGLASSTGVTTTFQGSISHYNPGAGISIVVSGTLTINPEENVLDSSANKILTVSSTGRLNLGIEITSPRDGSIRKTEGVAITGSRAQLSWIGVGSNASIVVEDGGELEAKGAITRFPGMYSFSSGSSIWLDGLEHHCHDYNIADGDIDPQTGVAVVDSTVGVNVGTSNRLGTQSGSNLPGRGYLGFLDTEDIRVDDWKLIGGGEFVFRIASDSDNNNTLSKTPNGFFGYSAADAKAPIISDRGLAQKTEEEGNNFIIENVRLANSGNLKSIALQSNDIGDTIGEAYITNAFNGTELTIGSDKLVSDARNGQIYGTIGRNINVDIKDGLDGSTITGGAFFYKDEDNGNRKSLNSRDDTSDKTFISELASSNLSSDREVILKIVNVAAGNIIGGTSNDERGQDRTTSFVRTNGTTFTFSPTSGSTVDASVVGDVYVFDVTTSAEPPVTTTKTITETTAGNTTFTVTSAEDSTFVVRIQKVFNEVFIGDLRTESGVEGIDTMNFVFWHKDYNPALFLDFDLQDDTVGTKTLVANILSDADYSSSTGTTADTPDELYDFIKQTKSDSTEALTTGIEYPTLSTLAVSKDGNLLDIGSRTFATTNSGTGQYTISDGALSAHTTTGFGGGTVFSGIKTTGSINLTNITLSTCAVETTGSLTNLPDTIAAGADITGTYSTTADKTLTVDEGDDYLGLALIVAANTTLTILGKSSISDFASINVTATGASVVFPTAATRLDIELSSLPEGATFIVYNDSVVHTSGTVSSSQADLSFSNRASDGSRTQISSGLGGDWYLYYVDTDKRATFKGVTVVETDSTTVIEEFKLTPTEFLIAFEVPSANITGRTLTVSSSDIRLFTDSDASLITSFPQTGGVFQFSSSVQAISFLSALGLSDEGSTIQLSTGIIFLRAGDEGNEVDFTGASFSRQDNTVTVHQFDISSITFASGSEMFVSRNSVVTEFDLGGCPVSNWADESQSSLLVANARNSVNYLNAMARQISRDDLLSIPTGENNNSVITFDVVRPVLSGADWRDGRYFLMDTEDGSQKVSGWYEVEDSNTFTQGTRTDRQLTNLESLILDDGDVQIQSQVRLLSSTSSVVGGVKSLTDPIITIVESIETKVDTVDTVVDSIETKTDTIDTVVDSIETKVDTVDTVVDSIETKVDTLDTVVDQIDGVNNFTAQQINDLGLVSDFDKDNLPSIDDI